ncbi:hypothetical protein PFISCL1PPCAC_11059, partial [Pristionchus fissidentatus]
DRDRISLILHMSIDFLSDDTAEQFHNWSGPISLTIVLNEPSEYKCAHQFINSLIAQHGFGMIRVHFLYRKNQSGQCALAKIRQPETITCSTLSRRASLIEVADYPMNMARNVAREFISTKFLLLSDVDLLFSEGFERRMSEIAKQQLASTEKRVLVFRIFEVYDERSVPRNKEDMFRMIENGLADTFHVESAYGHHELKGREEWLAKPENFTDTLIANDFVRYSRYTWEPRFVGVSSVPIHDEKFPYRIRANNVLGWEMCRAGYTFSLVEDLFTFHRAKRVSDGNRQSENNVIQLMNRIKYERALADWYARMDREYPETKGSCPPILRRKLWY